jgi:cytochrome c peroxidase
VGSDGRIACASCHFRAGADGRTRNTIHPGPDAAYQTVPGPGQPFAPATFAGDDRVGSGGVLSRSFERIPASPGDAADVCAPVEPSDPAQAASFRAGERLVTARQAPSVVGAAFSLTGFWDGRAGPRFDGRGPRGEAAGPPVLNASLASQAVEAALSPVEMSCAGRGFDGPNGLGARLLPRVPLAGQRVAPDDGVLGPLSGWPGPGLRCFEDRPCTYADLVAAAFGTGGLEGAAAVEAYASGFASLFGQAVQAYEATLVPDRTPYDLGTMTPAQVAGLRAFREASCIRCHVEPEFTDATVRLVTLRGGPGVPDEVTGSDQGFHNVGATRTAEDPGRAGSPGGTWHASPANAGAFKTPALRNVKLTAPYMHHGGLATLADVLDFYVGAPTQILNAEIDPRAVRGGVRGDERAAVLDFLENALTDCRVEHGKAPFDHPELEIPDGPALPARGAEGDGTPCP